MSSEAIGYVFRHSPYSGTTFAVHLAIADSVSDMHDHRFWMTQKNLAKKARISLASTKRAIRRLVDGGHIKELSDLGQRRAAHLPMEYQFLYPPTAHHERRAPLTMTYRSQEEEPKRTSNPLSQACDDESQEELRPDPFDAFWNAYPRNPDTKRHGGGAPKALTRKRFHRLKPADQQSAVDALDAYKTELAKEEWRRPMHASTYLSRRYWEDLETDVAQAAGPELCPKCRQPVAGTTHDAACDMIAGFFGDG